MTQNPLVRFASTVLRRSAWFAALFQALLIFGSLILAWLLRFDFSLPQRRLVLLSAPILIVIRLLAIWRFGLLHGWWRYVGVADVLAIAKADLLGSAVFFVVIRYLLFWSDFPRTVFVLEAVFTALLLAGIRLVSRLLVESFRQDLASAKQVVVIGAGVAAQMALRELNRKGSGYSVVACLDDDLSKRGLTIQGVRVAGTVDDLPKLFGAADRPQEAIIAIPSATSSQMRRFVGLCEQTGLKYRTLPALREIIKGTVLVDQFREVELDDLLGRDPVEIDLQGVTQRVCGKVVMVTGAAGSIGTELCRQIVRFAPSTLVCLDQNENGIFQLQLELARANNLPTELVFCVADIRDRQQLRRACAQNQVELIFHAAAYKHVPLMEGNVEEAIQNNVFALLTLLDVAEETNCQDLVLISSDKAVNPTSVMGATKRVCELILASRPANGLRCVSVRFGNVLGSSGSVVPIFQQQLRRNLPLTVTHPDIERYFMTISEAVSLVLQAFAIGRHGDILVLDMGEPVKIADLARSLIQLAGKSETATIEFVGLRPGEKMTECLFYDNEQVTGTSHPKIKRTNQPHPHWARLLQRLDGLRQAITAGDAEEVKARIAQIVPEYTGAATEPEWESQVWKTRQAAAGVGD